MIFYESTQRIKKNACEDDYCEKDAVRKFLKKNYFDLFLLIDKFS